MHIDHMENHTLWRPLLWLSILLFLVMRSANAAGQVQAGLPELKIMAGKQAVVAELANTDVTRQVGLMNRPELGADRGMLFIFKHSETQCMWMKNTLIDLDVAFADEKGRILNVEHMKAGTTDIHCSQGNAKLALEMNLNWFAKNGVGKGQVILVPAPAMLGY